MEWSRHPEFFRRGRDPIDQRPAPDGTGPMAPPILGSGRSSTTAARPAVREGTDGRRHRPRVRRVRRRVAALPHAVDLATAFGVTLVVAFAFGANPVGGVTGDVRAPSKLGQSFLDEAVAARTATTPR